MGEVIVNEEILNRLQEQIENEQLRSSQISRAMAPTLFSSDENENLVKWQLDIKEELERIEHLLRRHVPKRDENGKEWFENVAEDQQLFNEWGINFILNLLGWYLNKNIILSNFDEETIQLRVYQFSRELTNYIHNNYEKMGLDSKEKQKEINMVVMNLVNTVEAAYNRALCGGERESLRTARTVHQTEPIFNQMNPNVMMPSPQKGFSLLKPTTWGRM